MIYMSRSSVLWLKLLIRPTQCICFHLFFVSLSLSCFYLLNIDQCGWKHLFQKAYECTIKLSAAQPLCCVHMLFGKFAILGVRFICWTLFYLHSLGSQSQKTNDKHQRLQLCCWRIFLSWRKFTVGRGSSSLSTRGLCLAFCSAAGSQTVIPGLTLMSIWTFCCDLPLRPTSSEDSHLHLSV